jgi:hypothetical protein
MTKSSLERYTTVSKIAIAFYMGLLPSFGRRGQGPNYGIENQRRSTAGTSKRRGDYDRPSDSDCAHLNGGSFTDQKCQTGNHARLLLDDKFGYYMIAGLLIGAVFGLGLGAARGNNLLGIAIGALAGIFVGWFVAVATLKR